MTIHHHAISRRLLTVSQWNQFYPWPTPAGLRHLIFYAKTNGFHQVMRRVGRRVLIDEAEFFRWLDEQRFDRGQFHDSRKFIKSSHISSKVK